MPIARPQPDEYNSFYAGYIAHVPPEADLFALYTTQADDLKALVGTMTEEEAATPHKAGEWSVKQILGHINDTERVFAYRAICIGRGDTTPLPGFDQDEYVAGTDFNARTLDSLLAEFAALRAGNHLGLSTLTETEIDRRGTASNNPISVRALLFMLAGHVIHHIKSIKEDYQR